MATLVAFMYTCPLRTCMVAGGRGGCVCNNSVDETDGRRCGGTEKGEPGRGGRAERERS